MTIKDALQKGIQILKNASVEAPVVEAGVILCYAVKRDRSYLYTHDEVILTSEELALFFEYIKKRAQGEPVQHITGCQEFMSLPFSVNPSVLIPRQDTEILVEAVIDFVKQTQRQSMHILDIGTGSGCIAVSLAYYLENIKITAVDVSEKALKTAGLNACKLGISGKINFIKSDIFSGLKDTGMSFDIIVSNPPYIPTLEVQTLQVEVKNHEPVNALDGGQDGLNFYRSIISGAEQFLNPNGLLAFEVGYNQANEVSKLMGENFHNIKLVKDLSRIDRVVTGQLR